MQVFLLYRTSQKSASTVVRDCFYNNYISYSGVGPTELVFLKVSFQFWSVFIHQSACFNMFDDEEGEDGPKSSFTTYLAEGDKLYNASEYQKALESYSTVSS